MTNANPYLWSVTAATNSSADPAINLAEGQVPGSLNDSARAILEGVARFLKDTNGTLSTAGSSSAYTIASPNIAHAAYATGIIIGFKASATNVASATLNVNALGAKSIRIWSRDGEVAIPVGAIRSGGHYTVRYDAAANSAAGGWVLINPEQATVWTQFLQSEGLSGGQTVYLGTATSSGTEANYRFKMPSACIASKITIVCSGAPVGVETFTYTLRKNAVDTLQAIAFTGTTSEGTLAANPITFAAGDILSVKLVTSSSAATARHNVTLEFILA